MIVSFCGSQQGMVPFQMSQLVYHLNELKCTELVNGMCIGSDEESVLLAMRECNVKQFTFHPSNLGGKQSKVILSYFGGDYNWGSWIDIGNDMRARCFPMKPPLERNKTIVDSSKMLIATPKEFSHTIRSGTWSTIRYAWKKQKIGWQVIVIPPVVRD